MSVLCATAGFFCLGCRSGTATPPRPPDLPANTRIELARSMCYGWCPVYALEVHGDGTVIYTGEAHVRVRGRRTKKIPPEAVRGLVSECVASGLLAWKDRYESMATDLASTQVTIVVGTVKKTIDDYGPDEEKLYGTDADVRRRLAAIEHRIDAVAQSAEWVVCPNEDQGLCREW
jgi:hypothetical protein